MDIFSFDEKPGRTAIANGKEYLFFSGYSYLGMQCVPEFVELIKEGIDKYGWLHPSSRISNTKLNIFEEAETLLSSITGAAETMIVSSGFLAGKLAIQPWQNEIDNLFPSHPAITAEQGHSEKKIIAIDSVDPVHATISDLSFLEKNKSVAIIDDSHGFGLIGKNGSGIGSMLPENSDADIILSYSLSKASHINAGAVSCSKENAALLRTKPMYAASTPASPAMLYAFIKGQELYATQRKKLMENILYFSSLIKTISSINYNLQLPVFILPENIDVSRLYESGIIVSSFAYPDPEGRKINRVVLNALHAKEDLERLAYALRELL